MGNLYRQSVALIHLVQKIERPRSDFGIRSDLQPLTYVNLDQNYAFKHTHSYLEEVGSLLSRVALVELSPAVLVRALEPFPKPARISDAVHLASINFSASRGQVVRPASYNTRFAAAARAVRNPLYRL